MSKNEKEKELTNQEEVLEQEANETAEEVQETAEKAVEKTEKAEKYLTKYDRKLIQREKEKEKAKRDALVEKILSVVIVLCLVGLVAYFPIRNYMTLNSTYVTVGGEKISRVEYDYFYNLAENNLVSQYSQMYQQFGMQFDASMLDTNTIEETAIDNIKTQKALAAAAKSEGFVYDTTEEYNEFRDTVIDVAKANNLSERQYVSQIYGTYATLGRIKDVVSEGMYVNAFTEKVSDEKKATDEEIEAYYNENKANYDSVDYYLQTVYAELPTEPTELADPVEETDAEETAEATAEGEEAPYTPSEAEVAKAMEDAKEIADAAVETITEEGELKENAQQSAVNYMISDWLFDEARTEGETTVIEDQNSNCYYVVSFVKRYLDQTPSADVRVILATEENGQAIYDEWKSGAATEESFAEIADKYNAENGYAGTGGLREGITNNGGDDAITNWIFEEGRKAGDAAYVASEDGYNIVIFYVGENKAAWALNIANTLLNDKMTAYVDELTKDLTVEDPKGHLNYLKVADEEAEAVANAVAEEAAASEETAEDASLQETTEEEATPVEETEAPAEENEEVEETEEEAPAEEAEDAE